MAKLELDTREFVQALNEYQRATGKDAASILNRAGRNCAFNAIRYTKSAPISKIRKHDPARKNYSGQLFHALAAQEGIDKGKGNDARARELYNKRLKSRDYHKAGWYNALKTFGGNPRGKVQSGSLADKGFGKLATALRPIAILTNFAKGSEKQIGALQKAVNETARDMSRYARRVMEKTARRFSGR